MVRSVSSILRKMPFLLLMLGSLLTASPALCGVTADASADKALRDLLDRECVNLNKEKLYSMITRELAPELERGLSPELLKIMEGVIKRTDFDGIAEGKTVEIIRLVNSAYKQGAPLEFLDDIFDVAYVNTITVEQLAAAAKALKEFRNSDVPQDVYEEFVYHSIEDAWDPAQLPVFTRGLIYGVERGLSPDKTALIIMLDVKNGEARSKSPEQVVLDAIKLVREKEPERWRPVTAGERDAAAREEKARSLERRKQELDGALEQKDRAMLQAQARLLELREYPAENETDIDVEKVNKDLETLIEKLQGEINQYQNRRQNLLGELETTRKDIERQQAIRDGDRRARRERELGRTQEHVVSKGRSGKLDQAKFVASVNSYLGTPYRFGGDSERGIDCSAFTRRVYRGQGIELPRSSREQARVSTDVASVRAGDLVFFDTSISGGISHVGVYLGNNTFAHASSSKGVTKSSLREKYYVKRFVKGGRIFVE